MLHNNRPLGPYDIAELLGIAFLKCPTGEIAIGGFRVTGIFPFNRQVFAEVDFAPSADANIEEITLQTLKANKGWPAKGKSSTVSTAHSTHPDTQPTSGHPTAALDLTPSAKDFAETGPSRCSTAMNVCIVSPKDILLIPQSKKRMTNKGPEPMECAIVTSSPYKLALEEEKKTKKGKVSKKN